MGDPSDILCDRTIGRFWRLSAQRSALGIRGMRDLVAVRDQRSPKQSLSNLSNGHCEPETSFREAPAITL